MVYQVRIPRKFLYYVLYVNVFVYVNDSPTSPGIILPHTLDKVDFLWHFGSRGTRDIPQPEIKKDTKTVSLTSTKQKTFTCSAIWTLYITDLPIQDGQDLIGIFFLTS